MTRTPCPKGRLAALALRLSEAALASEGWEAVAEALVAETGPGTAIRFRADGAEEAGAADRPAPTLVLGAPGLGTWSVCLPEGDGGALALGVPLMEALASAARLEAGLPPAPSELEPTLDPLPYAAILLDADARLLFANAAGEDILASRILFRPARPGARLRPTAQAAHQILEAAIGRLMDESHPSASWLARGPANTHLLIRLRAVGPLQPRPGAARFLMTLRTIGTAQGVAVSSA